MHFIIFCKFSFNRGGGGGGGGGVAYDFYMRYGIFYYPYIKVHLLK